MASQLGWIDFSQEHRDRVFMVVDKLSETGAVDELGIGTVRDAIADWLFPGVSTIQTRPKYFILIPQIILSYLQRIRQGENLDPFPVFLNNEENLLMQKLAKNYNYEEGNGVMGINIASKGHGELVRKPSSIYWNGLRTHGIIETSLSLSEYLKKNDLSKESFQSHEEDDMDMLWEDSFGLKIPFEFGEITDDVKMDLSKEEATFLEDQFISNSNKKPSGNLLKQIFKDDKLVDIMLEASTFNDMAEKLLKSDLLPPETEKVLRIAIRFDFLMHGAHIRYNIQLHKLAGNVDYGKQDWEEWIENLDSYREQLIHDLNFDDIFTNLATRTKLTNRIFMKSWFDGVVHDTMTIKELDDLVKKQELNNKGSRAKLLKKSKEYGDDEWIGLKNLQYRFKEAKEIVKDIQAAYA